MAELQIAVPGAVGAAMWNAELAPEKPQIETFAFRKNWHYLKFTILKCKIIEVQWIACRP
jgi:hypothetical protein